MQSILSVRQVSKTYASGHHALDHVDLDIRKGEIFALPRAPTARARRR